MMQNQEKKCCKKQRKNQGKNYTEKNALKKKYMYLFDAWSFLENQWVTRFDLIRFFVCYESKNDV